MTRSGLIAIPLTALFVCTTAVSADFCATPAQIRQIENFYADNPGTIPVIAAQRLDMPDAVVASGLPRGLAVSAGGGSFADVWTLMSEWQQASFLIMKGKNVFEIMSRVGAGTPSTRSEYYNIAYDHPLRGHLRPDLYSSIYAVDMPSKGERPIRGVMFFGDDGAMVFGVFISGESLEPVPGEEENFARVWELIAQQPQVCLAPD